MAWSKAKRKAYMKEYNKRPEVIAKRNANRKKRINSSPYNYCFEKFNLKIIIN